MASNNRIDNIGGVWYFPLYDANGNVTDYVSETGEVVASYAYDAFGRTIAQSGSMADTFPFRFSTKYYDAEADLYYYGYRYYSPELGRWLTRDPIEEDGGDNLYAFCGNDGHALCLWLLCWSWRLVEPGGPKRIQICVPSIATNRQAGNAYPKIPI